MHSSQLFVTIKSINKNVYMYIYMSLMHFMHMSTVSIYNVRVHVCIQKLHDIMSATHTAILVLQWVQLQCSTVQYYNSLISSTLVT